MSRPVDQMNQQLRNINAGLSRNITKFFVYSMFFPVVGASATDTRQLVIQADSDFLIQQITVAAIDPTTPLTPVPLYATAQFVDTGSGMNVFDQPIPLTNFAGNGQLPYILSTPLLLNRNAALTGTLTNFASTNPVNYYVSFLGQRIYNLS